MKATGIVRKVDELGRVVLPIELRRTLDIHVKAPLEIFVDDDQIVLRKFKSEMTCQITGEGSGENLALGEGKIVLSPQGAEQLLGELEQYLAKN